MRKENLLPLVFSILFSAAFFAGCGRDGSTAPSADETDDERPLPMLLEVAEQYGLDVDEALGLAVHPSGGLLIGHKGGVLHVDAGMRPLRRISTAGPVVAIAVTADGRIFAAERTLVRLFDGEGNPLGVWHGPPFAAVAADKVRQGPLLPLDGAAASEPMTAVGGKFAAITDLVVEGDFVRVADAGARAIFRFAVCGDYAGMIGGRDSSTGQPRFVCPSPFMGIDIDSDGLLLIGNPGRHRVEYYDGNGRLLRHWGRAGGDTGDFSGCCNPSNLAAMADGRVVVAEKGERRLMVFDAAGKLLAESAAKQFSPAAQGIELAVGTGGEVYALDGVAGKLLVLILRENPAYEQ